MIRSVIFFNCKNSPTLLLCFPFEIGLGLYERKDDSRYRKLFIPFYIDINFVNMFAKITNLNLFHINYCNCCGATVGSEQQHGFITFYQNALHLTRVHCGTFYQNALRHEQRSLLRLRVSLWQIFYGTVRGLTKFKTRRSLSDEYHG